MTHPLVPQRQAQLGGSPQVTGIGAQADGMCEIPPSCKSQSTASPHASFGKHTKSPHAIGGPKDRPSGSPASIEVSPLEHATSIIAATMRNRALGIR